MYEFIVSHDDVSDTLTVFVLTFIINEFPEEKDMVPVGVMMY